MSSKKVSKSNEVVDKNEKARTALFRELIPVALAKTLEAEGSIAWPEGNIAARAIAIAKCTSEQVYPGPVQGLGSEE